MGIYFQMRKGEQELLERTEKDKKNNEQEPRREVDHQQGDFLEDGFDGEFWIKVRGVCI